MKPNLITSLFVAILFITTPFISCTKQYPNLDNSPKSTPSATTYQGKASNIAEPVLPVYSACGMKVNVFSPKINSPKQFSYAYNYNGALNYFSVLPGGDITTSTQDKFTFEFAGYLNTAKTVTSWRIRRIDGKYLTDRIGDATMEYLDKISGVDEGRQIFLLASYGKDTYVLLMPKIPICNIVRAWNSIDGGYVMRNDDYNLLTELYEAKIVITATPPLSNQ